MSVRFSNRTITFLFGISLGLLAGASFFIFKMDNFIGKLNFFKSKRDTVIIENKMAQEKEAKQEKKNAFSKNSKQPMTSADSLAMKYKYAPSSKYLLAQADSLLKDTTVSIPPPPNSDEIVVKKDELVASKNVLLTNAGPPDANRSRDSLLSVVSGIRDDKKNAIAAFTVEFWQSPINYKGYKMGKSKIVLFGIAQGDEIRLYRIGEDIYLRHLNNVYRLDYSNDFRQFEKIMDKELLAKLK